MVSATAGSDVAAGGSRRLRTWVWVSLLVLVLACPLVAILAIGLRPSPEQRFERNRATYAAVAEMAIERAEKRVRPDIETWWLLPKEYRDLSDGGEVLIEYHPGPSSTFRVHFYVVRGLLGSSMVYLYCPAEDCTVSELAELHDSVKPLGGGWFLVDDY